MVLPLAAIAVPSLLAGGAGGAGLGGLLGAGALGAGLGGLTGKGEGPDITPTGPTSPAGVVSTGQDFLNLILQGAPGETKLEEAISSFDLPLQQLIDAIQGKATGTLAPQIARGTEASLLAQSAATGDIERFAARQAGGRGQFGVDRLRAQTGSEFGRQRAGIPLNVFTNTIQNFLPLLAQRVQAELGRAATGQAALSSAQAFEPVSLGRQAQAIQRGQAGIPPESKDLSGFGTAAVLASQAFG